MTDAERAAYAAGWRAGAKKMRAKCASFLRDAAQDQYALAYDARARCKDALADIGLHVASNHVVLAGGYSVHADGTLWILLPPVQYPEGPRDG
jgi:hypothetical protein